MSKPLNPELIDVENPEWTDEKVEQSVRIGALPATLQAKLRRGRPQASVTKERITIRLSPHVVDAFRATGSGWQTRMDAALKDWLKTHSPS
ncbi:MULTISPECIES: BrnA antitoxin family protein [unclassified Pseudomonas]|uniref:BrnA antitoxin family protein n=1 Tax=unclassified Pseudomonas TaxID=196821 RepID=UPI00131C802F|nr:MULTISPECIES: BrnA antitoxin family protein [unclassified Pseudomonas]